MADELPIPAHLASEFYVWLWWSSEQRDGVFDLGGKVGRVEVWIDERLTFKSPDDTRVSAVLTGENPSTTLEARAALAGGKVLQDLRVGMRRDDREYRVTLRGPEMHLSGAKFPAVAAEGEDEVVYERMFLYGELNFILGALLVDFATVRTSEEWGRTVLPSMRTWVVEA